MTETGSFDYLFKVMILGECGVGKSSFLLRFTRDRFLEDYIPTIGIDFSTRRINIDDKLVKLQVWDVSGQTRFRTIITAFFRGVHGVLLLYDVTNADSFENIEKWAKDVAVFCDTKLSMILVGNGSDKKAERIIKCSQGKELADKLGIPFLETSSKLNTNVEQAFIALAVDMKTKSDAGSLPSTGRQRIGESSSNDVTHSSCCEFCNFL